MTTGGTSFWSSGAIPFLEPESLSGIIAAASDIALVIDDKTTVLSALISPTADGFGNLNHWEGRPIIEFLADDSIEKFQKAHAKFITGEDLRKPIELNHEDNATWKHPVRYTVHRFGQENTALLLGRDLRPIAETQQQLVQAQIALEQGYEARREFDSRYRVMLSKTREAIVFVSLRDGRVSDCSDAAATLLGLKRDAAAGTTFSQLLKDRSSAELMESMLNASLAEGGGGSIEVKADRSEQRLIIEPSVFRAGGQRILHCILSAAGDTPRITDAPPHSSVHRRMQLSLPISTAGFSPVMTASSTLSAQPMAAIFAAKALATIWCAVRSTWAY